MPRKPSHPNQQPRAPNGSLGKPLLLRLPPQLRDLCREAARRADLSESEWWRQAGRDALMRLAREG